MEETNETQEENIPMELGLDWSSRVILALGGLGSLLVACLLTYGALRVGLFVLRKLAEY